MGATAKVWYKQNRTMKCKQRINSHPKLNIMIKIELSDGVWYKVMWFDCEYLYLWNDWLESFQCQDFFTNDYTELLRFAINSMTSWIIWYDI